MSAFVFFRLTFIVLSVVALSFALPVGAACYFGEFSVLGAFLAPAFCVLIPGIFLLFFGRKKSVRFSTRSVFLFVALVWLSISLFGTFPLWLSGAIPNFVDAFFESCSGFSTTGCTILPEVESLPKCVNLWRCQMHWLGGMGIIALTVALLPLLGVGGFNLIKAESTGPEKGKITPKMANTAEMLWLIYGSLTVLHAISLRVCGMGWLDSIAHAFSTMGTGGFSTRNESIGSFNSPAVEWVCILFMFLAGINFSIFFYLLAGKFDEIRKNTELKAYVAIFLGSSVLISLILIPDFRNFAESLRAALFQVGAVMTTSGYMTSDYCSWPEAAQFLLFFLFFTGGCAGSTSGGFKVVRWCVLAKHARNEMTRMLRPHGVFSVRLNGISGRNDLVFSIGSFLFIYFALSLVTAFFGTLGGLDVFSSFTAALSIIGNVGPAFGMLGPTQNYGFLPPALKLWYCFAMVAGRLELYNLLIFVLPSYWKK